MTKPTHGTPSDRGGRGGSDGHGERSVRRVSNTSRSLALGLGQERGHRAGLRLPDREERLSSVHTMRLTISLSDEQAERLKALCRNEGISAAEAVRRAVDRYLEDQQREDVFGIWQERATDGSAYERRLREEWS